MVHRDSDVMRSYRSHCQDRNRDVTKTLTNSSDPSTDGAVLLEAGHHTPHEPACSDHQQTQPAITAETNHSGDPMRPR